MPSKRTNKLLFKILAGMTVVSLSAVVGLGLIEKWQEPRIAAQFLGFANSAEGRRAEFGFTNLGTRSFFCGGFIVETKTTSNEWTDHSHLVTGIISAQAERLEPGEHTVYSFPSMEGDPPIKVRIEYVLDLSPWDRLCNSIAGILRWAGLQQVGQKFVRYEKFGSVLSTESIGTNYSK